MCFTEFPNRWGQRPTDDAETSTPKNSRSPATWYVDSGYFMYNSVAVKTSFSGAFRYQNGVPARSLNFFLQDLHIYTRWLLRLKPTFQEPAPQAGHFGFTLPSPIFFCLDLCPVSKPPTGHDILCENYLKTSAEPKTEKFKV